MHRNDPFCFRSNHDGLDVAFISRKLGFPMHVFMQEAFINGELLADTIIVKLY